MEKKDLKKVSIEELISYSKQKEVPTVTIIEDVTDEEFKYVDLVSERLKLRVIMVEKTNMIAFIDNSLIACKIAKELRKKSQVMYYDFSRRPSGSITIYALTGYTDHWIVLRDNGYKVFAYNEEGEKIDAWIDTNIKDVKPVYLNSLKLSIYKFSVYLRGKGESGNVEILRHSRINFVNDGIYNEKRNCYYPSGKNNKDIAEHNKLEKLFKKWGFNTL